MLAVCIRVTAIEQRRVAILHSGHNLTRAGNQIQLDRAPAHKHRNFNVSLLCRKAGMTPQPAVHKRYLTGKNWPAAACDLL